MAAVCGSSFVYHSYSSFASVSADSDVPRMRCFSASYGSWSRKTSQINFIDRILYSNVFRTFGVDCSSGMVQVRVTPLQGTASSAPSNHFLNIPSPCRLLGREFVKKFDEAL